MKNPRQSARHLFFALAMLGLVSPQIACRHERSASELQSISEALQRQADRWDQDIILKNLPAIASNMSEDFRHISHKGVLSGKATFLRGIVSNDLVINPYTVEDLDIRIYENCALLCGRTRMTGSYRGSPFRSHYRYVDTYILKGGQWKVCNVQITAMPD